MVEKEGTSLTAPVFISAFTSMVVLAMGLVMLDPYIFALLHLVAELIYLGIFSGCILSLVFHFKSTLPYDNMSITPACFCFPFGCFISPILFNTLS